MVPIELEDGVWILESIFLVVHSLTPAFQNVCSLIRAAGKIGRVSGWVVHTPEPPTLVLEWMIVHSLVWWDNYSRLKQLDFSPHIIRCEIWDAIHIWLALFWRICCGCGKYSHTFPMFPSPVPPCPKICTILILLANCWFCHHQSDGRAFPSNAFKTISKQNIKCKERAEAMKSLYMKWLGGN